MGEAAEIELRFRRFMRRAAVGAIVVSVVVLAYVAALLFFLHAFFGSGAD